MNAQMNEEGVPLKCCTGCPEEDQWHPATTEFFYHHPSTKDKYTNKCKKCISHQRQERIIIEKPTNCACCGNPITQSNRGKIRQFCDNNKCKQIGRSFCRFCGKSISQSQGRSQRRQFCDNNQLCQKRYHRMGTLKPT